MGCSEPFESSWEFFYPTPYSQVIETRERTLADTCDAHVSLAEIPFVSLRHGLPQALLQGRASYRGTVEAARAGVAPASLEITLSSREVRTHGKHFTLPPSELALLCVFARRAMHRLPPLTAPAKGVYDSAWAQRLLAELRNIAGPMADLSKTERALRRGMDGEYFSSQLSKLRRSLHKHLDLTTCTRLIDDGAVRPRLYRMNIDADKIAIQTQSE